MREQRPPKRLIVGIQARSTSKRLPGKVHASLGDKTVLNAVLDAAQNAVLYVNRSLASLNVHASICLLVPKGDVIAKDFKSWCIEGDENDVLSRYKQMADQRRPDYVVRITADCPLIPAPVITNVIKVGVVNDYDYAANFFVDHGSLYRLVPDGFECEFISTRMLDWADKNATSSSDREHVTPVCRTYPDGFKFGVVIPHSYQGDKKLSVDTHEDLERIRKEYEIVKNAREIAEDKFGKQAVHKF